MITFEAVRAIALALPGVEEGSSYGTPAFRVKGKFIYRLRDEDESLVVKVGDDFRDMLLRSDPDVYFVTDHYAGYPAVLVRLSAAGRDDVAEALEQAWRHAAPKKLIAEYDAARKDGNRH
jgi:hypothetical protein